MVDIERAARAEQLSEVASLMRAFSTWALTTFHADDDLPPTVFEKLEAELATLPGRFAPPKGVLLIATSHGQVVGCLGGAALDDTRIEASRLWVSPAARGYSAGALLIEELIAHARAQDFETIVLRSHRAMTSAHRLYLAAGFTSDTANRQFSDLQNFEVAMELPLHHS